MADKHLLPRFAEAASILFRGRTWNRIARTIEGFKPLAGNGIRLECTPSGVLIHATAVAGGTSAPCPFGQIISWLDNTTTPATPKTGISGGIVNTGINMWHMLAYEIDLGTDGSWLVYLSASVKINLDDNGEILLPGVYEGNSKPTWHQTTDTDYPSGTAPVVSTGDGTIILPVGLLTVSDGAASITTTGCGGYSVGHCSGTLFYTRI